MSMQESLLGKKLDGRYKVTRSLAVGGFSQTYVAEDVRRPGHPQCVVKLLTPASNDVAFIENAKRLFMTEAETLERLGSHSQIPRLLAHFVEGEDFYLVQEYIDGSLLSEELLVGECWPLPKVVSLIREILQVLTFIHSEDVIHRDIKPDNIIRRREDGRFVLVDFGTVKQIRKKAAVPGQEATTIAVGTPGYMPTEQSHGKPRTSSDVYALGVIAIQAITGLHLNQIHEDEDTGELIWQPYASCEPGLVKIIEKMVRYHFRDRYRSASEALHALEQYIECYPELASVITPSALAEKATDLSLVPDSAFAPSCAPKKIKPRTRIRTRIVTRLAAKDVAAKNIATSKVATNKSVSRGMESAVPSTRIFPRKTTAETEATDNCVVSDLPTPSSSTSSEVANESIILSDESIVLSDESIVLSSSPSPQISNESSGWRCSAAAENNLPVMPKAWQQQREVSFQRAGRSLLRRLSQRRMTLAITGFTTLAFLLSGGLFFRNHGAFARAEKGLEQAEQFQKSSDYEKCVAAAQTVSSRYAELHSDAQNLMGACWFSQAEILAADYKLQQASLLAFNIKPHMAVYPQAKVAVSGWSESIFQIAIGNYRNGEYEAAQSIMQAIPVYSELGEPAEKMLDSWEVEWQKNAETLAAAEKAVEEKRWQRAVNETEKITLMGESVAEETSYWKETLQPIVSKANAGLIAEKKAAQAAAIAAAAQRRRRAIQSAATTAPPAAPVYRTPAQNPPAPAAYTPPRRKASSPTAAPTSPSRGWPSEQR